MTYESFETFPSTLRQGIAFTVRRMSFARRLEFVRRVRELLPRLEFFQGGSSQKDDLEARLINGEIDKLYVEWGLESISGLSIDGNEADPVSLCEKGPEDIFQEALSLVKKVCWLTESEAKN